MVFNEGVHVELSPSPKGIRIYVMKNVEDAEVLQACKVFNMPISVVENFQADQPEDLLSVYVMDSFAEIESNRPNSRILGRTAFLELAKKKESGNECIAFTEIPKPLFSHALSDQRICLANFKKEDLITLRSLINQMNGCVDEDINGKVTHLVTNLCCGERYSYAVTFDVCILSEDWIYDAWKRRNVVGFNATENDFISKYKLKPFHRSRICFLEYSVEEEKRMIEALRENGGEPTDLLDHSCTHLVVNEKKINTAPPSASNKTFVVKTKWFWASVQHGGRLDEKDYVLRSVYNIAQNLSTTSLRSLSQKRSRKRKRPRDSGQSVQKRRLSEAVDSPIPEKPKKTRYDIFSELLHTERNYVSVLRTIMTLFKGSLEKLLDTEDQLLNATELKIIFSHLPPIFEVHGSMLKELERLNSPWNDNTSIGQLILKYLNDLAKAYPPFTNFFLNTREMLIKCDKTKPRFHAFLRDCQLKPECGRQSLQELLISPVQRLFQIDLLLKEILKYTSKSSVDYKFLEQAIIALQDVLVHINEAKRKIESQVALFEIFNKIDNCPAQLVSSQRHFISRCEVTELSDNLSGRGDALVLFLFSDIIEVCKKRKAFNSLKSPKENGSSKQDIVKLYKHVQLLPLNAVSKVIDVKETEDCHNVFALRVKQQPEDSDEKTFSFTITDESIEKSSYLHALHTQIVNVCKTDEDNYLINLEARQLDIDTSDVATGTLGRTFNKFTSKTRVRVGRALSFNSTPNRLKRAVSSMMSPFSNLNGLTPSSQLANLQLSSLPNISTTSDSETILEK